MHKHGSSYLQHPVWQYFVSIREQYAHVYYIAISLSVRGQSRKSLASRVLGEFGDDPERFEDVRARKNYSGQSPITRASGRKRVVLARYATNRRLGAALHQQALCSLRASPGARAYYDALRARNIGHHAALRQLANRLVGILHGCLKTGTFYDENTAWAHRQIDTHTAAA